MFWKKNAFSYCLWLIYSVAMGSVAVFALLYQLSVWPVSAGIPLWERVLITVGFFGMLAGGTFYLRKAANSILVFSRHYRNKLWIPELLLMLVILGLGFWSFRYKLMGLEQVPEGFLNAFVTENSTLPVQAHGTSYLYLGMLRGIFLFLGNKIASALWIQMLLVALSALILYRAVRRLFGRIPAMGAFAFLMLSPYLHSLALNYSPMVLYFFLYATGFYAISNAGRNAQGQIFRFVLSGTFAGICTALDLTGMTLLVWNLLTIFMVKPTRRAVDRRVSCILACIGGSLLGFLFSLLVVFLCGGVRWNLVWEWCQMFAPQVPVLSQEILKAQMLVPGILLCGLLFMGVISFWLRKKEEGYLPIMWVVILAFSLEFFGCISNYMDTRLLVFLPMILLSLAALWNVLDTRCMVAEPVENITAEEMSVAESMDELTTKELPATSAEAETEATVPKAGEEPMSQEQPKPRFLENPLPVPKKKPKKSMEYTLNDIPEDDDFDHLVGDNDDYDF